VVQHGHDVNEFHKHSLNGSVVLANTKRVEGNPISHIGWYIHRLKNGIGRGGISEEMVISDSIYELVIGIKVFSEKVKIAVEAL